MSDTSNTQAFLVLGAFVLAAVRWLVLIAATILILFVTWLLVSFLWSRGDKESISIKPFVVVDPSGNLKNGDIGFAQILAAQMADLQVPVLQARAVLRQAAAGEIVRQSEDTLQVPSGAAEKPNLSDVPWPQVHASSQEKVDLKVQGVDVSGVLSWIKSQLVPERKGLAFAVHIAPDGNVTIAGDVSDMGLNGFNTVYLSPARKSPIIALNDLALQLLQLRLAGDEPRLRDLAPEEFRELVEQLNKVAGITRGDTERKQEYGALSRYFSGVLEKHSDWQAMTILAAETARRAGSYSVAQKYLELAEKQEVSGKSEHQDAVRVSLIRGRLTSVSALSAAQERAEVAPEKSKPVTRKMAEEADLASVERLREGFQTLYETKGETSYTAIAGLPGAPAWYGWNHERSSRSSQRLNLFLPWNRAFLLNFERAAREHVPEFALLCWDWSKAGVPKIFSDQVLSDGKKNPLAAAYIDLPQTKPRIERYTTREITNDGLPFHSAEKVEALLAIPLWRDFAMRLEEMSDIVHASVGGDMGSVATASYDPLFYAHHCNVDRIWASWQKRHGSNIIDEKLLDVVLDPFGVKVRDVLDIKKLGVNYPTAREP